VKQYNSIIPHFNAENAGDFKECPAFFLWENGGYGIISGRFLQNKKGR